MLGLISQEPPSYITGENRTVYRQEGAPPAEEHRRLVSDTILFSLAEPIGILKTELKAGKPW